MITGVILLCLSALSIVLMVVIVDDAGSDPGSEFIAIVLIPLLVLTVLFAVGGAICLVFGVRRRRESQYAVRSTPLLLTDDRGPRADPERARPRRLELVGRHRPAP